MVLAPLSRTVVLTEDGSTVRPSEMVTIPPRTSSTPTPVSIGGAPPTTGTVGQPYSFTPSTANGSGTKTFSLAGGTLLAGLALNTTTGAITGTPTAAGTMTGLSVRVTDSTGSASTTATTVTIAAASGAATINNTSGTSTLLGSQVSGFTAPANALDTRLTALGA